MKRFLIGSAALVMCVALVGCGDVGGESTLNNLGSQLDETSNIISSVQTINPADINLTKDMLETIATNENSVAIYDNVIGTQQTLLNEEYYKTDILSRTAKLKNNLSKDLKLSKAQAAAIKELTHNLEKYSNSVAYTQNDMSSTLRQISSLKKNVEKNSDKLNAKLNRLACNSNARSSYYENIIFTLSQIENYLDVPQSENQNTVQENQNTATHSTDASNEKTNVCPNCNFLTQSDKCENCGYQICQDCKNEKTTSDISQDGTQTDTSENKATNDKSIANNPYTKFDSNNINRINMAYPYGLNGYAPNGIYGYGRYGFNGMNGYGTNAYFGAPPVRFGNGMGMYGAYPYGNGGIGNGVYGEYGFNGLGTPYAYGGMNGNNINFARFNPNRNTDTYAPFMRNIDTYRAGTSVNAQPTNQIEAEKPMSENGNLAKEDNSDSNSTKNNSLQIESDSKKITQIQQNVANDTSKSNAADQQKQEEQKNCKDTDIISDNPQNVFSLDPEQRLENFEKVNDENLVEKQEDETCHSENCKNAERKKSNLKANKSMQKDDTKTMKKEDSQAPSLLISTTHKKDASPSQENLGPPVVAY